MNSHANPDDRAQGPVISINVQGDAQLNVTATASPAGQESSNQAALPNVEALATPLWHRTSVIWSAVAAAATVAGVVGTWLMAR
ncbi:hypothetical protein [Streptomyces hygroscopicus]|uniref:hypothetical protein n=1 Tax=Streptomyces hygroscopicus TaxID=1912 RepID=UPI0033E34138